MKITVSTLSISILKVEQPEMIWEHSSDPVNYQILVGLTDTISWGKKIEMKRGNFEFIEPPGSATSVSFSAFLLIPIFIPTHIHIHTHHTTLPYALLFSRKACQRSWLYFCSVIFLSNQPVDRGRNPEKTPPKQQNGHGVQPFQVKPCKRRRSQSPGK